MSCLLELHFMVSRTETHTEQKRSDGAGARRTPRNLSFLQPLFVRVFASERPCKAYAFWLGLNMRQKLPKLEQLAFAFSTFTRWIAQFACVFTAEIRKSAFLKWLAI